jgi:hypothetical protein
MLCSCSPVYLKIRSTPDSNEQQIISKTTELLLTLVE